MLPGAKTLTAEWTLNHGGRTVNMDAAERFKRNDNH